MRLLILATTKFAPTYNEKLISQINYFNSFDNMKADIFIDASLVEIEKMLSTSQYDLIYPTVTSAPSSGVTPSSCNAAVSMATSLPLSGIHPVVGVA